MRYSETKATASARNTGGAAGERTRDNVSARNYPSTRGGERQGPKHGRVHGDVWTKSVRGSVHMLKVPRGWALDLADLDRAEGAGVTVVDIHDLEQLNHHFATIATIRARGSSLDRGHGKQIALALEYWRPSRQEAESQHGPKDDDAQSKVVQLDLFGQRAAA